MLFGVSSPRRPDMGRDFSLLPLSVPLKKIPQRSDRYPTFGVQFVCFSSGRHFFQASAFDYT